MAYTEYKGRKKTMAYVITDKCNGCTACSRLCPVEAISGERKQQHEINAGQCIECGVCGKVCAQGAILDGCGVATVFEKRTQWPKPSFEHKKCMSCTICVDACPVSCIGMSAPQNGKKGQHEFPFLKNDKACIGCGFCSSECPVEAVAMRRPVSSGEKGTE